MDPTTLFTEFAKAGLLPLAMAIVIYILWNDNVKWRNDYNTMRDKMQDKIDAVLKQATDAINVSVNQTNAFSQTLASMMNLMTKQGEQWQLFKDEILRILREDK